MKYCYWEVARSSQGMILGMYYINSSESIIWVLDLCSLFMYNIFSLCIMSILGKEPLECHHQMENVRSFCPGALGQCNTIPNR